MSHFSVAVFTDEDTTVDDLLEPFYEGLEVEKYIALTKEDVIKRGKELIRRLQKIYKEYRKDKTAYRRKYSKNIAHLRFIKRIPIIAKWKNDRIYKEEIKYYEPDELPAQYEDGGINYETMGFGPICKKSEQLVDMLCKYMDNNCITEEEYIKRADDFFAFDDHNNCQRIYDEIKKYMDERK